MAESGVVPMRGWGKMASDGKDRPDRNKHETMADGKVVSLGRDVQVKIGQHLRTMYDDVVKQGVPDHLNELLEKLDRAEKPKGKDDKRQ
jgi:hypothetical protein